MTSKQKTFRLPEELITKLAARATVAGAQYMDRTDQGGLSSALRESLDRYFYLLGYARDQMRDQLQFTSEELANLCSLGNATRFDTHSLDGLQINAEDALTHEVPYPDALQSLRAKLLGLNILEHAVLVDAVERFWRASSAGIAIDPGKILD